MSIVDHKFHIILLGIVLAILMAIGLPASALAASTKDFIVVLDAGHGGKDHGAIDNGVREKDINLAVTLRLGELIKKKLKNTQVVYTRDDDTFVSLQGRAEIANKAKGDLFISIHTNSVDAKNKNRRSVAGASVYTQGGHKDDANLAVAQRENSVIELENGYEQKYSGFDPNKVESYIIFEMAAKQNLTQSHRFAKNVQDNLVKVAGRADRGVHQAGFWVLWATYMPSALIELDFICNPESAKFISSKAGVDKLAEAIFEAVKTYEQNFRQKQRMLSNNKRDNHASDAGFASDVHAEVTARTEASDAGRVDMEEIAQSDQPVDNSVAISHTPEDDEKDLSHANLKATSSQHRARHASEGRRRRSASSRSASDSRNLAVNTILVKEEFTGETTLAEVAQKSVETNAEKNMASTKSDNKGNNKNKNKNNKSKGNNAKGGSKVKSDKKSVDKRQWVAEVNKMAAKEKAEEKRVAEETAKAGRYAGGRRSLKSGSK